MRRLLAATLLALACATSAVAQVSIGIAAPGVSIGIQLPVYPHLVPMPGYPVYYAPRVNTNYFFYDGMYWVFQGDTWYASAWYNGPWSMVPPLYVPAYVLRVPVRYYRSPPVYFRGWRADAPPRWGDHWGQDWQHRRDGWDRRDRSRPPPPAPLPIYQRKFPQERYPQAEQQPQLHGKNYRYQPHDPVVREHFQPPGQSRERARDEHQNPGRNR